MIFWFSKFEELGVINMFEASHLSVDEENGNGFQNIYFSQSSQNTLSTLNSFYFLLEDLVQWRIHHYGEPTIATPSKVFFSSQNTLK